MVQVRSEKLIDKTTDDIGVLDLVTNRVSSTSSLSITYLLTYLFTGDSWRTRNRELVVRLWVTTPENKIRNRKTRVKVTVSTTGEVGLGSRDSKCSLKSWRYRGRTPWLFKTYCSCSVSFVLRGPRDGISWDRWVKDPDHLWVLNIVRLWRHVQRTGLLGVGRGFIVPFRTRILLTRHRGVWIDS